MSIGKKSGTLVILAVAGFAALVDGQVRGGFGSGINVRPNTDSFTPPPFNLLQLPEFGSRLSMRGQKVKFK
jgi:hypothetical protein